MHVINNGIYNAYAENIHPSDSGKAPILGSLIGNYAIPGKNSHKYADWAIEIEKDSIHRFSSFFVDDNYCKNYNPDDPMASVRNLTGLSEKSLFSSNSPVPISKIKIMSSKNIKAYLLDNVGARPHNRDSVDTRILKDFKDTTGNWIDSQNDVGGWPILKVANRKIALPQNHNLDDDNNGYSNLEEWIFSLTREFDNELHKRLDPPFLRSAKKVEEPQK